jgi:hypothetical protein
MVVYIHDQYSSSEPRPSLGVCDSLPGQWEQPTTNQTKTVSGLPYHMVSVCHTCMQGTVAHPRRLKWQLSHESASQATHHAVTVLAKQCDSWRQHACCGYHAVHASFTASAMPWQALNCLQHSCLRLHATCMLLACEAHAQHYSQRHIRHGRAWTHTLFVRTAPNTASCISRAHK